MLLVGLTGNIASGKSSVARRLTALGATVIDADLLAREAVAPGEPALAAIVERWGPGVLSPDGSLDRAGLRTRVFSDPDELEALNSIVHPQVGQRRGRLVAAARARGDTVVVCDIPLLFERGLAGDFDRVVLVDAPRDVRLGRIVRDRALPADEAMRMIAAQMPAELKRARADVVIDNDGSLAELHERVDALWADLAAAAGEPARARPPRSR